MLGAQAGDWIKVVLDTIPAQIILWVSAFAALGAGAVRLWKSSEFVRRLIIQLVGFGTTVKWPNGSEDLPSSLSEIYRRQGETHDDVKALRKELNAHIKEFEEHISLHRR